MPRARTPNRRVERRGQSGYGRRSKDVWASIAKVAGVVASSTGAIIGQAELVGEPYRHYLTVTMIGALGACAFLLGPQHVKLLAGHVGKVFRRSV